MPRFFWTQMADVGPSARLHHAMCFDRSNRRAILFGGDSVAGGLMADTWMRQSALWTQIADTGPQARHSHAMCASDSGVILFGGRTLDSFLGDTWRLSAADWTQVDDAGPSARSGHGLVFDPDGSRAILFGGRGADGALRDTWQWSFEAERWTQLEDTGPVARRYPCMAYDLINRRAVLFGGEDSDGRPLGDTWALTPAGWAQIAHFGAPASVAAAMVATDVELVAFGGLIAPVALSGSTWSFDGQYWTQRQDMGPAGRWAHSMCFDEARRTVMLFGGTTSAPGGAAADVPLGDTWEHDVVEPAAAPGGGAAGAVGDASVAEVTVNPNPVQGAPGVQMSINVRLDRSVPVTTSILLVWMTAETFQASQQPGAPPPPAALVHALPQMQIPSGQIETSQQVTNPHPAPGGFVVVAATGNGIKKWCEVQAI